MLFCLTCFCFKGVALRFGLLRTPQHFAARLPRVSWHTSSFKLLAEVVLRRALHVHAEDGEHVSCPLQIQRFFLVPHEDGLNGGQKGVLRVPH